MAFADALRGIVVGGDYTKTADAAHNIAVTSDGGKTWTEPAGMHPAGFRSLITPLPGTKVWVATGTSGSDVSSDGGATWRNFDTGNFNAASFVAGEAGFAVGPKGRIARYSATPPR